MGNHRQVGNDCTVYPDQSTRKNVLNNDTIQKDNK